MTTIATAQSLQSRVDLLMRAGLLFGSAVVQAQRDLGLPPVRLITVADLEDRS